jgi:outer membrane protein assembly factor BamB
VGVIHLSRKKIISLLSIVSFLVMLIPAVPLVESLVLEKNIFGLSDLAIDDTIKSTENSYIANTENTIENNIFLNDRETVNYVGIPIWIYDSDYYVQHVKTADLNGDGIKDVIAGEYGSDYYTDPQNVYAINGLSGNTMWTYTLNDGVRSMDICDLNNDGVMDVVAGASYGSPGPDGRVHAIDGTDGSYIWRFTPGGTGDTIGDIAFGDFNGDIYPDVAIACWDDYVYAINGQTGTQLWRTYIGSIFVTAVDTGDVNGDGRDDISFANSYLPGWDNLQGVLDGTDGSTIWNQTVSYTVENTLLSDIDNDGALEAIYGVHTDGDPGLAQFYVRNSLTGALEWNYTLGPDIGLNPDIFLFSNDIDEDGDLDLVVGNEYVANYIYAFEGDSSTPMWVSEELGGYPRDMAFGDVIGDGYKNIVIATYDRVQILNATDGTKVWYYAVGGTIRGAGCADFNNDGILDVLCSGGAEIVGHDPGKSVWALKTTEESPILWEFDADEYGSAVAIDNLNGDIYMDVIGVTSNDVAWAVNGETGVELWHWTATDNVYSVTTGDFNGDGQIDVAVAGYDNIVTALYGNTGSIMWQFTTPTNYIGRKCLQSTDLDNDGKVDVIAGSKDGNLYAINGNTGTELWIQTEVTAVNEVELAQMDGYGPLDVVTVDGNKALVINGSTGNVLWQYDQNTAYANNVEVFDLNNDGYQDIAIGVQKMGATPGRLIMVDGLTHSEIWTVYPFLPCSDYCLSNGDLNNDGIKDLVAAGNYDDKKVHAYNGTNGNQLWSYEAGGEINVVKTVDLNYDGNIEVLAGSDDQYLYVFKGDGSVFWSISTADDVIHLALGDISGDGYPNIAVITFGFDAVIYAFRSFYEGQPPIADFTYEPLTPYTYTTVYFNSTSYDQDGYLVNWTWDMDDGTVLYGENVTHQYTSEGSYTIILTVTDNDGIPDSYYKIINVLSSLPTANFIYQPYNPAASETVYFNSTSFSPVGYIVNWSWNFGDGNFSYGEFVTHQYINNDSYNVNHTVIDNNGFIDSIIKNVVVGPLAGIPFTTGWNLITIPIENNCMASTLASNITGCQMVSWFDAGNQTYKTHIVGVPGYDFIIQDGYGLFILVNQSSSLTMSGVSLSIVSVPLSVGWNMIGWYHYYDTTASNLAGNISGCQMVSWFDAINQTFKTHIVGVPGYDFIITRGMGLFILVDEVSIWHGEG